MKILVVLLLQLCTVYSAKYLVYNVKFSRSHTIYMNRIADTLAKHGHEVVSLNVLFKQLIILFLDQLPANLFRRVQRHWNEVCQNDQPRTELSN